MTERIKNIVDMRSGQVHNMRTMEAAIQIEGNKITERFVNDPHMNKKQKQEVIMEVRNQVRKAIEELHNFGKDKGTVPGRVLTDLKANLRDDELLDLSDSQQVDVSKVTNEDIERLKKIYPLPKYQEKFEWAVQMIEKYRQAEADAEEARKEQARRARDPAYGASMAAKEAADAQRAAFNAAVGDPRNTVMADGTVKRPDGSTLDVDGTVVEEDGTTIKPDGTIVSSTGTVVYPDGRTVMTNGAVINADGTHDPNSPAIPRPMTKEEKRAARIAEKQAAKAAEAERDARRLQREADRAEARAAAS